MAFGKARGVNFFLMQKTNYGNLWTCFTRKYLKWSIKSCYFLQSLQVTHTYILSLTEIGEGGSENPPLCLQENVIWSTNYTGIKSRISRNTRLLWIQYSNVNFWLRATLTKVLIDYNKMSIIFYLKKTLRYLCIYFLFCDLDKSSHESEMSK